MSRVREVDYRWHLRQLMATRGLFSTTDLAPLLAERGIELSAAQVYRLVAGTPERLNLHVLVALCDALGCTPDDLVQPVLVTDAKRTRRAAGAKDTGPAAASGKPARPTRAKIVPDK